jgi:hypothetical protein
MPLRRNIRSTQWVQFGILPFCGAGIYTYPPVGRSGRSAWCACIYLGLLGGNILCISTGPAGRPAGGYVLVPASLLWELLGPFSEPSGLFFWLCAAAGPLFGALWAPFWSPRGSFFWPWAAAGPLFGASWASFWLRAAAGSDGVGPSYRSDDHSVGDRRSGQRDEASNQGSNHITTLSKTYENAVQTRLKSPLQTVLKPY